MKNTLRNFSLSEDASFSRSVLVPKATRFERFWLSAWTQAAVVFVFAFAALHLVLGL